MSTSDHQQSITLSLDTDELSRVRRFMCGALERAVRDGEALRSHLGAPRSDLSGKVLVFDVGGSHVRAALLTLESGRAVLAREPLRTSLQAAGKGATPDLTEFFRAQARLARELSPEAGIAVGYCFSYPCEISPRRDGRVLRLTKSLDVPGLVGGWLVPNLVDALRAEGVEPGRVTVLNDAVACLLGGSYLDGYSITAPRVGLIVGTGTNMAGFLAGVGRTSEAWNFESGRFLPAPLSPLDTQVDASSMRPGDQLFEKAVSGLYLPALFERIAPDVPRGDEPNARVLHAWRASAPGATQRAASELLSRSADLVAAGLAALSDLLGSADLCVYADGGVIRKDERYRSRVEHTYRALQQGALRIVLPRHVNLVGAACAALAPDRAGA